MLIQYIDKMKIFLNCPHLDPSMGSREVSAALDTIQRREVSKPRNPPG